MIDFSRALSHAWEQMMIILFRPFNPEKWFYIGCSAFLALMAQGGVSLNNPIPLPQERLAPRPRMESVPEVLHYFNQQYSWLAHLNLSIWVQLYLVVAVLLLVVWVTMNWIGSRGEFIFLDNIVRNRVAFAEPWRRYAREGNTWFFFHFALMLLTYVLMAALALGFIVMNWTWIAAERDPNPVEIGSIIVFGLLSFGFLLLYSLAMFLIQSIVLPLYFKQAAGLGQAFRSLGRLMTSQPGNLSLFLLASIVLGFVTGLVALFFVAIACCFICWFACIPFVGSVLMGFIICQLILPILVFTRCFQLNCLAEMGPEYDVWRVDVPPGLNPPPPRG